MKRQEQIEQAKAELFPIGDNGRNYEQALSASGFDLGVKWADEHPRKGLVKYVKLNNKDIDNSNDIPLDLIKKVTPIQDKEGNLLLAVEYYDDELCINCVAFRDYIEVIERK